MTPRVAVLPDFAEEGWPSMDRCAAELLAHLPDSFPLRPRFRRPFGSLPVLGRRRAAFNADRLVNRHLTFPLFLRRHRPDADAVHVADHSYAQLVHALPARRTGVYCHDIDAFRCLVEPGRDPRPRWFRLLARRTLAGMQKAAVVFHSTPAVRADLVRFGLADPARLVHAPYGTSAEFVPEGPPGERKPGTPYLLHVGSCVPRKRIDVLLDVFAAVRARRPGLTLVQVGGEWTGPQAAQLARHGLAAVVRQVRGLTNAELAALYRGAAAVVQPSEAEGFGLPVAEALACGAAVVASDIPPLRDVGGPAVLYAPVADTPAWCETVIDVLDGGGPPRAVRRRQAARFSWAEHARIIGDAYRRIQRR